MNRAATTHGVAEQPHDPQPPTWLSIRETSSYLGVGTRLVRRLVREGHLPARRLRGAAHIPKSAIDDLLDQRPRGLPQRPRPPTEVAQAAPRRVRASKNRCEHYPHPTSPEGTDHG